MPPTMTVLALSAMLPGQEADIFVLMTAKEQLTTREGKPYYRVGFRDGGREVVFPIWDNSPWARVSCLCATCGSVPACRPSCFRMVCFPLTHTSLTCFRRKITFAIGQSTDFGKLLEY